MNKPVTVSIVDDSSLVRGLLRKIIENDNELQVISSCGDGETAIDDHKNYKPDVMLMDVEMPYMDGLMALRNILSNDPCAKVVMCSSLTQEGSKTAFKALQIGALECIGKPSTGDIDRGENFANRLVNTIKTVGRQAKVPKAYSLKDPTDTDPPSDLTHTLQKTTLSSAKDGQNYVLADPPQSLPQGFPSAIVIGTSTGGPQALPILFETIKSNPMVPIFVTQHMPIGFETCLAEAIQKKTDMPVCVAENGMSVLPNHIYIAPSAHHMVITNDGSKTIRLDDTPPVNFCKPSINVMIDSIHTTYKQNILTVLMTGMGEDGKTACKNLYTASPSNLIIAQDEKTSIIWGIPGAVAREGLCHGIFELDQLGGAISALINRDVSILKQ